jgi:hypothetical protein
MAIAVTCTCGKKLRVADENAGRKIRCPACERVFRLPEDDDERDEDERDEPTRRVRADRPAAKKPVSRRGRDDEDEDDERDEPDVRARRRRPSKDRKRSALPLILGGVALLVLLGGGGFTGYWFLLRGGGMDESAFLAPDAQAFVTVRLADVAKLDGFQKAMKAQGGNPLNDGVARLGLTTADIERVTYVAQELEHGVGWGIVTTTKPYDQKAVLAKLTNATAQKHEGKTYHVGQAPGVAAGRPGMPGGKMGPGGGFGAGQPTTQVVFFAGPKLLVLTNDEASMKRGISAALGKGAKTGPLAEAMKQVGGPRHVAFAFTLPPGALEKMKGGIALLGPQAKPVEPLLQFTGGSGSMDFGANVLIELALQYPDATRAEAAMKSFTALKALAEAFMAFAPDPKAAEAMKAGLAGLTAQQRGAELAVKLQVASQVLEGMVPAGGMPMR